MPEPPKEKPCKLDEMPAPAKLVVVQDSDGTRKVMLLWADRFHPVDKDDVAWGLPVGARILRTADGFEASQLDRPELPPIVGDTARDLIGKFREYIA